jgi:mRNA-degrading endonuclease toxin of MazEF toxin-antitoxin module
MFDPGDIVTGPFPGVEKTKRRPMVVISTPAYHAARPDVLLGQLTTQIRRATAPTDYHLRDWAAAGLRLPSAFRVFLATVPATLVTRIGRLSDRDWQEVQARLRLALAV